MYEISPIYARVVFRHCRSLGIPVGDLLQGTRLSPGQLQAGGQVELGSFVRLLENAQHLSGERTLGLLIGSYNNPSALGYTGLAMSSAPTIREGLQAVEQFSRLQASYIQVDLISTLDSMSMRLRFLADVGDIERLHTEAAVMLFQDYLEMVMGKELTDAHYRMGFPKPEYADAYSSCMHSKMSFGWPQTSVEIPLHWLDVQSPYFDAEVWRQSQFDLALRLKKLGQSEGASFSGHLRALLRSYEPPLPGLAAVATRLHISDRTLNRRLQKEGTNFRELRADILHDWSCRYLRDTQLSIDAISSQLGYLEPANFRRAFKARESCSPGVFRNEQHDP